MEIEGKSALLGGVTAFAVLTAGYFLTKKSDDEERKPRNAAKRTEGEEKKHRPAARVQEEEKFEAREEVKVRIFAYVS